MLQNEEKYCNVRLSETAVMSIHKYRDDLGDLYHQLNLKYEDTNEEIDFGTFLIKPKRRTNKIYEGYEYNNEYIISYSYNSDTKRVLMKEVFHIGNRMSLLSREEEDSFGDYYTFVEVGKEIRTNKYKKVKIKKK